MSEIQHFAYGLWTPLLAFAMSFMGALIGLRCTVRAQDGTGRVKAGWLALGAVAIGGTGVWVMHFIAMLGFRMPGAQIRYDVPLTLASIAIAVVVVGAGLFIVGFGGHRTAPLLGGGALTGVGVAVMHYLGMSAMHLPGHIDYDPVLVTLSVVIALVASVAALWAATRLSGTGTTTAAAAIMSLAVGGMHYTGMAAMKVHAAPDRAVPSGAEAFDLLLPLILGISLVSILLLLIIAVSPREEPAS